ncbi:MAG: aminotransferase class I/II-fold pyridoxal phosphate-dependent enzyme [Flammeovirgaceae bacterium]|nr:aminotransferase class I/II-fold pyridoxal phosphate-dependent enzyme [Flammeovirgaceae bacterium]
MLNLTSRLPEIGTSIFAVMSKMANEEGAINLSQGFPDFPVSENLIELVNKYMREGHNQYAPMPGVPALRNRIAEVVKSTYGRDVNPETEVTVTAGGTQAIFAAIAGLIGAGDEVIIFDPSYDCYDPAVRLNGGVPIHIDLIPPTFAIDWGEVKSRITERTRMIMINTPHNPSGVVLEEQDLRKLEKIAEEHDLIVLSDEVYERIIFGKVHNSVLKFPLLAKRSLAVFSFGKTFHTTGWKVGYVIAPESISKEIRKAHQFITFSVNTPVQLALAEYMSDPENFLHLYEFYQAKRDFFLEQVKGSAFEPMGCLGSYFQLLSYKNISDRNDCDMAEWMTRKHKLASIPVSVFYNDGSDHKLLRFCFAKGEDTMRRAGEVLRSIK